MVKLQDLENYIEGYKLERGEVRRASQILLSNPEAEPYKREDAFNSLFRHYVRTVHRLVENSFPDDYDEDMLQAGYAAITKVLRNYTSWTPLCIVIQQGIERAILKSRTEQGTIKLPKRYFEKIRMICDAVEIATQEELRSNPSPDAIYDAFREIAPRLFPHYDPLREIESSFPEPNTSFLRDPDFHPLELGSWMGYHDDIDPNSGISRIPQTTDGGYIDQNLESALSTEDPDTIILEERRKLLYLSLESLSERDRTVLKRRFLDEKTLKEIGKELGRTREIVRQIEYGAICRMRRFAIEHFTLFMVEMGDTHALEGFEAFNLSNMCLPDYWRKIRDYEREKRKQEKELLHERR